MDVSVEPRLEALVEDLVAQGRFASASDVMNEGLKLVEIREAKLKALRESIEAAITEGGTTSDDELELEMEAYAEELRARMRSGA